MPQKKETPATLPVLNVIPPATTDENPSASPEPKLAGLIYCGGQAIIGVPARDLSASELTGLGLSAENLLNSGLYRPRFEEVTAEPETTPETETENE